MADWSLPRKPRKSNFSTDEVDVLVDSVKAHYNVLYGKFAKRATNRWIRQKAWMDILKKVNGVSIEKRTLQEVKNKWKKCQYALKEKVSKGALADDPEDSWDDMDSMPLQERLSKVAAQEKIAAGPAGPLKSQPLSPTKLKVTRQNPKVPKHVEPPQSPVNEEMCLRWNSHHSNMQTAFPNILSKEQYVDVTLAAEGKTLKCHRLILSSCSPYFEEILNGISPFQHPVLFMRDIPFWILKSLCDFMYAGEVHIFQNKLEELLTVAEALKIKGLAGKSTPPENQEDKSDKNDASNPNNNPKEKKKQHHQPQDRNQHLLHPPPLKKNPASSQTKNSESASQDYDDDLLDPLDLLEPLYEEVAEEKKPASTIVKPKENKYQYQPMKRPFTRRLRKRKFSEQREPSPPPVFSFRKGTRSRPNVKIPKYYHSDYSNPPKPVINTQTDPLLEVDEIKTEPIDVEDNLIDYSDEDHYMENSLEPANCDSPIIITSAKPPPPQQEKFKKIKLSKPIITEVHSIEETNTTAGGLEVIKITLQQPPEVNKTQEAIGDPLQGVIIRENEATTDPPVIPMEGGTEEPLSTTVEAEINEEPPPITMEGESVEPPQDDAMEAPTIAEETPPVVEEVPPVVEEVPPVVEEVPPVVEEVPPVVEEVPPIVDEVPPVVEEVSPVVEEIPLVIEEAPPLLVEEPPQNEETDYVPEKMQEMTEPETAPEEVATSEENLPRIEDVRTTDVEDVNEQMEPTSLDHLEKEAMDVANAINMETQEEPPDIE